MIKSEGRIQRLPLEGKLSPKVTDEVSYITDLQFLCQKINLSAPILQSSE